MSDHEHEKGCPEGGERSHCGKCCTDDDGEGPGCVFSAVDKVEYAPDAIVSSTLADNDAGTMTVFAFDAGQRLSTHSAPYDASVYVIDGEAEITVGGETFTVGEGQMTIMPADVPHAVAAEKQFKMILIMFRA